MNERELQTQFLNTIENASVHLPSAAYSLATTIAKEAVEVYKELENAENVNPEYEHVLETVAFKDLPNLLQAQTNLKSHPTKESYTEYLYAKLISLLDTVRTVKTSRDTDLMQNALSYTLANNFMNKQSGDGFHTDFVRTPSTAEEIAHVLLPILTIDTKKA